MAFYRENEPNPKKSCNCNYGPPRATLQGQRRLSVPQSPTSYTGAGHGTPQSQRQPATDTTRTPVGWAASDYSDVRDTSLHRSELTYESPLTIYHLGPVTESQILLQQPNERTPPTGYDYKKDIYGRTYTHFQRLFRDHGLPHFRHPSPDPADKTPTYANKCKYIWQDPEAYLAKLQRIKKLRHNPKPGRPWPKLDVYEFPDLSAVLKAGKPEANQDVANQDMANHTTSPGSPIGATPGKHSVNGSQGNGLMSIMSSTPKTNLNKEASRNEALRLPFPHLSPVEASPLGNSQEIIYRNYQSSAISSIPRKNLFQVESRRDSQQFSPPVSSTRAAPVTPQSPLARAAPGTPQSPLARAAPGTPQSPIARAAPGTPQSPIARAAPGTPQSPIARAAPGTPQSPLARAAPGTPQSPMARAAPGTPQNQPQSPPGSSQGPTCDNTYLDDKTMSYSEITFGRPLKLWDLGPVNDSKLIFHNRSPDPRVKPRKDDLRLLDPEKFKERRALFTGNQDTPQQPALPLLPVGAPRTPQTQPPKITDKTTLASSQITDSPFKSPVGTPADNRMAYSSPQTSPEPVLPQTVRHNIHDNSQTSRQISQQLVSPRSPNGVSVESKSATSKSSSPDANPPNNQPKLGVGDKKKIAPLPSQDLSTSSSFSFQESSFRSPEVPPQPPKTKIVPSPWTPQFLDKDYIETHKICRPPVKRSGEEGMVAPRRGAYDRFIQSGEVFKLGENNFNFFLNTSVMTLVMFYDSSQKYYKKQSLDTAKKFVKAAEYPSKMSQIFAAVDCSKEKSLCASQKIMDASNPTVRLFAKDTSIGDVHDPDKFATIRAPSDY